MIDCVAFLFEFDHCHRGVTDTVAEEENPPVKVRVMEGDNSLGKRTRGKELKEREGTEETENTQQP